MREGIFATRRTALVPGLAMALFIGGALADTLVLRDGRSVEAPLFRREGESIVAIAEVPGPDGKPIKAERVVALPEIVKVVFTEPAVFRDAGARLGAGEASSALPAIVAATKAAEPLGTIPGSFWPDLQILQAHTLVALGRNAEAETIAAQLKSHADGNVAAGGQAISALVASFGESSATTISSAQDLLKAARTNPGAKPSTIAAASVACGLSLLEKEPRLALKCFLELPVFLPGETALSGIARLGTAKSYFAMSDFDRAISSLEELIKTQPGAPEAAKAKTLLPDWQRRRTVFNESK